MKYLLAFAAMILLSCLPAYAQQQQRPTAGPGVGYGGSIGGSTSRLPVYPSANFQTFYVSGADNFDFSPSTFRSYDQALKEGQAALNERAKTIVEIAKETKAAERPKARLTIEQDASGRAIIETK
jgi:hypothetical protein